MSGADRFLFNVRDSGVFVDVKRAVCNSGKAFICAMLSGTGVYTDSIPDILMIFLRKDFCYG